MLRPTALFAALLLVPACGREEPAPRAEPTVTTSDRRVEAPGRGERPERHAPREVPREVPRPVEPDERREIRIESIGSGNPIVVKGRARTFENSVSLRLRDAGRALIIEDHVTSVGEIGRHNPFEAQIWVTRDPGRSVTVEAFEYSAKDGSIRSLTAAATRYDVERIPVTLHFPAGDCTRIVPFRRMVPKSVAMARLLVEALLAGPTAEERKRGATSPFPKEADVRSVVMRNGEVTVDFNERLRNTGGSCAAQAIRDSVVKTLRTLPTVRSVTLTAGGSRELALQP